MMTTFIVLCLAMAFVAVVLVCFPLVRRSAAANEGGHAKESLELLREQFAELSREYEAGRLAEDEYRESREELEARVLEESKSEGEKTGDGIRSRSGFYTAAVLAVLIPVVSIVGYLQMGTVEALDPEFLRQAQSASDGMPGHSDAELMEQVKTLEERLAKQPDNADGWMMLARVYAMYKNWGKSSEAYAQVDRLVPNNADVLSDWADVMAAASGSLEGKPEELIQKALSIDPNHWKGLALMGTVCFDRKDYAGAVKYWERMRAMAEQGSSEWRQITDNIEQARELGGIKAETSVGVLANSANKVKSAAGTTPATVSGTVDISPELKAGLRAGDVLFVYARPTTGSKMPVAFVRIEKPQFPVAFHLTSADQMAMGMRTLSEVDEVVVEARISHSGNFMSAKGDLEGSVAGTVKVGSKGVAVKIDRTVQ